MKFFEVEPTEHVGPPKPESQVQTLGAVQVPLLHGGLQKATTIQ